MSSVKVQLYQKVRGYAPMESGATVGAQVGVNLLGPDGELVNWSQILNSSSLGPSGLNTTDDLEEGQWNLYFTNLRAQNAVAVILNPTANITFSYSAGASITADLTTLADTGGGSLRAITRDAYGRITGTRLATITGTAGRVTVANGSAAAGLPTIDLATVANAGGGALLRFVRDAWGRITGTSAAALADLSNVSATAPADTYVLTWVAATSKWTAMAGGGGGSPLTTKGDVFGFSTAAARVPVGADGTFLAADSTAPLGVSYKTPAGGSGSNLYVNTTAAGNVGTGVQNLMGYAVPGGTLATAGDILRARASFSAASTINAKSFQIKFGATTVFDSAGSIPVSAADDLVVDVEIIMVTGTTQLCNVSVTSGNTTFAASAKITASGETLSGSVTLQCTGSATTTNDIVQKSLSVWKGVGGGSGGATLPAGSQIGFKRTTSATKVSGTGTFPDTTAIPLITGGNPLSALDTSYTPTSATSLLEIEVNLPLVTSQSAADFITAIFQDSISNALAAGAVSVDAAGDYFRQVCLRVIVPASSTTARTYKVRYGASTGTAYVNGGTIGYFGTSIIAVMTIKEISQ